VEPEESKIAAQKLGKQVPAATNMQATIEELLETVFSVGQLRDCIMKNPTVNC
jgi:hypothetical protein